MQPWAYRPPTVLVAVHFVPSRELPAVLAGGACDEAEGRGGGKEGRGERRRKNGMEKTHATQKQSTSRCICRITYALQQRRHAPHSETPPGVWRCAERSRRTSASQYLGGRGSINGEERKRRTALHRRWWCHGKQPVNMRIQPGGDAGRADPGVLHKRGLGRCDGGLGQIFTVCGRKNAAGSTRWRNIFMRCARNTSETSNRP
jgi:hypothetical protein